jgi:hypothetical protein
MRNCLCLSALASAAVLLCSCSEERDPSWKETYPVTGEVYVDGQPVEGLYVQLHPVAGVDTTNPTFSGAMTDKDGKFAISTYEEGDGVPAGEYTLTFMWGQLNLFSMQYGGPDKLNNKYNDPKTSSFRVSVANGEPTDLGRIELTTKKQS